MKQSSKINQKDLPLYDLTIFWCKNQDQGQGPSSASKTRSCYQQGDPKLGTKDATFTAKSHARLNVYSSV